MRAYDPTQPLFIIHLPKTAGVSVRTIYRKWFQDRLLLHYYDEAAGQMPQAYDLRQLHSRDRPVVVYGHFNRTRGFGVDQYYPEARQFVTILREPLERALSGYFYTRKHRDRYKDQSRIPADDLRDYLLTSSATFLNQLPAGFTLQNYEELLETSFVEIGVMEHLDESMVRVARKIGMPYTPGTLPRLNVTEREPVCIPDDLRDMFMSTNPLDYAIYNYVLARYEQGAIHEGVVLNAGGSHLTKLGPAVR